MKSILGAAAYAGYSTCPALNTTHHWIGTLTDGQNAAFPSKLFGRGQRRRKWHQSASHVQLVVDASDRAFQCSPSTNCIVRKADPQILLTTHLLPDVFINVVVVVGGGSDQPSHQQVYCNLLLGALLTIILLHHQRICHPARKALDASIAARS